MRRSANHKVDKMRGLIPRTVIFALQSTFCSLVLLVLFTSGGCLNDKVNTITYLFLDVTEGLSLNTITEYRKSVVEICTAMDLDLKKLDGGHGYGEVHFSLLNYEYFTIPIFLELKKRDEMWDSDLLSKAKVANFIEAFKDTFDATLNIQLTNLDTSRSVITRHIIKGLEELLESNCQNKIMVIYSDMIEHNPEAGISLIDGELSSENFGAMTEKLRSIYKINFPSKKELSSISIYIIRPDHEKYRDQRLIVEEFWKSVLGDCCKFQSELNIAPFVITES